MKDTAGQIYTPSLKIITKIPQVIKMRYTYIYIYIYIEREREREREREIIIPYLMLYFIDSQGNSIKMPLVTLMLKSFIQRLFEGVYFSNFHFRSYFFYFREKSKCFSFLQKVKTTETANFLVSFDF